MGGGGDSGGYEAKQAEIEARKQQARDALNKQFGIAPSTVAAAPDRAAFTTTTPGQIRPTTSGDAWDGQYITGPVSTTFDQAGYDKALAGYTGESADVAKNKAGRDAIYSGVRDNAFTAGKRSLDEGRDKAARANKFTLFAQGLNGGSEDIDQNALLGRTYNQGLLDLGAKADSVKSGLQSSDESARLGLLQSIDAGMDQTSAISSAINQMQNASNKAASDAQSTTLGDLFDKSGALYTKSQAAAGKQAGVQDWWNQYRNSGGGAGATNTSRYGLTTTTPY